MYKFPFAFMYRCRYKHNMFSATVKEEGPHSSYLCIKYLGTQWMNDLMVVQPTHNEQWNQSLADMEHLKGRHVSIIDVMCATKTTHVEEGPHSSYLFIKYLGRDTTNKEIGL